MMFLFQRLGQTSYRFCCFLPTAISGCVRRVSVLPDSAIAVLEGKLANACELKQGMMQELLTGKMRLA